MTTQTYRLSGREKGIKIFWYSHWKIEKLIEKFLFKIFCSNLPQKLLQRLTFKESRHSHEIGKFINNNESIDAKVVHFEICWETWHLSSQNTKNLWKYQSQMVVSWMAYSLTVKGYWAPSPSPSLIKVKFLDREYETILQIYFTELDSESLKRKVKVKWNVAIDFVFL